MRAWDLGSTGKQIKADHLDIESAGYEVDPAESEVVSAKPRVDVFRS
jgi:hypothetical protein